MMIPLVALALLAGCTTGSHGPRKGTLSFRAVDRPAVRANGGMVDVRELYFEGHDATILVVHSPSMRLFWWAPLQHGDVDAAARLFVSEDAIADFTTTTPPPQIVARISTARAATLDDAQRTVVSLIAGMAEPLTAERAYRTIDLAPYLDRSFYEAPFSAINPAVFPHDVRRDGKQWILTIRSTARKGGVIVTLTDDYEVVQVRSEP